MKGKRPYVGEIKNTGSQVVRGPYANGGTKHGTVRKGDDLRTGTKSGKK